MRSAGRNLKFLDDLAKVASGAAQSLGDIRGQVKTMVHAFLAEMDMVTREEFERVEALAQKARERKVTGDELKGGTFTISNQGAIGGAHFTPIINKPEVAILGVGRGALKPVVRDGKVEVRMLTPLGLSYDHRVIDGGAAARFIVDLVKAMEGFEEESVKL